MMTERSDPATSSTASTAPDATPPPPAPADGLEPGPGLLTDPIHVGPRDVERRVLHEPVGAFVDAFADGGADLVGLAGDRRADGGEHGAEEQEEDDERDQRSEARSHPVGLDPSGDGPQPARQQAGHCAWHDHDQQLTREPHQRDDRQSDRQQPP